MDTSSECANGLESVGCPLCGGGARERIFTGGDLLHGVAGEFGVDRCLDCGFAFTNPRPSPEAMAAFYPDSYAPHQAKDRGDDGAQTALRRAVLREYHGYPGERGGIRKMLLWPAEAVLSLSPKGAFWPEYEGRGRVLDVGCGAGRWLWRLARESWRVQGLDISAAAADMAREHYGVPVAVGTYPHEHFAAESFDLVTMWNSLEHMHDPLGVLASAARVLVPGGRLIAGVPNFASFGARRFGRWWFPLDLPRHLNHFTPRTITTALERAGLRFDSVAPLRKTSSIRRSARYALAGGDLTVMTRIMATRAGAGLTARLFSRGASCDLMVVSARKPGEHP